ncbi:flagellar hook-associated protein FlgK [Clostridium sp. A1-XYC3]|uniref:Flagellar hook-associated protein 1 n=1 Tax=Clostridium tanneri TaxID=3037988 RepID=A0ABU4JNL7_9CLOT|nr:flagellar hook-associated protein FlgK [Clostridium sp. A1-XYC3]MDW8799705.1 flagellar hook-associated protein FlgK [Clostridium sp. A1-XYC3]
MSGLFGTFHVAKRGLFAQQRAIDVTSHNIANANTEGYSRQRVQLETTRPFPMPAMNNAAEPGQIGTGVAVAAINRIRDSFLDYQVRVELGVDGQFKGRDKFLSEIENILNEPSDTGMSTLIGKFFDSWNTLATSAKESNARSIVAQQSLALTNELNHTYARLENLKDNTQTMIKDTVFDINSMLGQLNQINQQIKQVKVAGNIPNDLMDKRDLLLDKLSTKFGIKIDKKDFEGIDVTTANDGKYAGVGDNGTAPLDKNGKPLNIVQILNPNNSVKFSYIKSIVKEGSSEEKFEGSGSYTVTYYKNGDTTSENNKVTIKVKLEDTGKPGDEGYISAADKFKQLDESRVLWANNNGIALKVDGARTVADTADKSNLTDKQSCSFEELALFKPPTGELKGYMSVQSDVDTYEGQLDKFAKALAFAVNGIISQNKGSVKDNGEDINNFFVNGDAAKNGVYTGDESAIAEAEQNITAANITINTAILDNPMRIKTAAKYDENGKPLSGESDGKRALAVEMLRDKLMKIQDVNTETTKSGFLKDIFSSDPNLGGLNVITNDIGGMTLDSYFKDTVNRLGIQEQEARRMVENEAKVLAGFEESRASVSGVSLDEEMANLVQFQHCYQANAKIISTVDELLDVVINGLKR